jgi:hypothetical protein
MDDRRITDEQVTTACNLHIDNLRRLITWGAVKPVQSGGGRGRVRLWSLPQAMRIALTAEFFEAGFSLQMAHTLTYCLPFDDMLALYDPKFLSEKVDLNKPENAQLKEMLHRDGKDYWPGPDNVGHVIVLDRRFVYADILGDTYQLFAIIEPERNRLHPMSDPRVFYFGVVTEGSRKRKPGFKSVTPSSLLIDQFHFTAGKQRRLRQVLELSKNVESQIDDPTDYVYRNCVSLDLGVGLAVAFRKLLGLPAAYPYETEREDD